MFGKGCAFFAGYILLRKASKSEPTEYVALQNLGQSVEIILKSLLLIKDYDKYKPLFGKKNGFGHDLSKLSYEVNKVYRKSPLSRQSVSQIQLFNKFYCSHRLRYGTGVDLFISPSLISRTRIVRLLGNIIKISSKTYSEPTLTSLE